MKLATFTANGVERFGLVLHHPARDEVWIFDPEEAESRLDFYASRATSPFQVSRPRFLPQRPCPQSMTDFLALGDVGMDALRRLQEYLLNFLQQSDQALLAGAGFPLDSVELRAPIPRPRLFFGLVQNSPTFARHAPHRQVVNIYPQGHQRPQGSVIGPDEVVYIAPEMETFGWTPEPGVIIGRKGKNIPITESMQYVAGYTVVMDLVHDLYTDQLKREANAPLDWFEDATGSWLGKKSDTLGAMGPFLTTKEEVGNPYDLLMYTRQSGWQRDRAHTGSMVIGFERLISWLSSFMTLYPGDVLHMGTMAVDGMPFTPDMPFTKDDYIEGDLERVGALRLPVVLAGREDWRPDEDLGRRIHAVPAVRDLMEAGAAAIATPEQWRLEDVRHFWTVYGNYRAAEAVEGLAARPSPRVLNCPASALATTGSVVDIPERAHEISVGVELAFVVSQVAHKVAEEEAAAFILGYIPMAVLHDSSFADPIRQPATPQEQNLPAVYARWADGFNVVSSTLTPLAPDAVRGRAMRLDIAGYGSLQASTDEYLLLAPRVLSFLSQWLTVFPGDVITLGRTHERLTLPSDQNLTDVEVQASVAGVSNVQFVLADPRRS
jgi:2-keto-4-pentenoate hydratase/2-oxohepta-3-ene-1,7-dioic acid hydratase in catechol pathway